MALLLTMRRCVALRAPAHVYRRRCLTAMLDTTTEPLDAATVDWRGLRAEAARRLDRATKKIAKKSAKAKTLPESLEALKKTEAERDRLRELVDALNAVDGSEEALTLANALGVRDAPPPRQPRGPKKKKGPSSTAPRLPYNAFASESGVEIRVGRRASDNDLLSCDFRYRDGADWWLHAAGCPGSHVVIRSHDDNLPANDGDAVRDAACLAALDLNPERVIEALLDNNPPQAVSHLSPQLAKIATVRGDNRRTGDVSINEARRRQKARLRALEKREQEDAALRDAVYDDDYDDRYDGLQEPTILTGDQDAVRRANALVRADEEEEAYWVSQRNANSTKSAAPAVQPKRELTAKQIALQRRRKTKNKGAQHHQKDRAARKV